MGFSQAIQMEMWKKGLTWIGLAAVSKPAIPPPITRPSGPANETLRPPVLFLTPPISVTVNDPDKDNNSKRPCNKVLYLRRVLNKSNQ